MSDEERQRHKREAKMGDKDALARVERDAMRTADPGTRQGWVQGHLGKVVFLEGIRINWRGLLGRILYHGDGKISDLVFEGPCQRIGDMSASKPNDTYTLTTNSPETLVPWDTIIAMCEDCGFNSKKWPSIK